jgi:hypothetical protein
MANVGSLNRIAFLGGPEKAKNNGFHYQKHGLFKGY